MGNNLKNRVLAFAAETNSNDFYNKIVDYINHYKSVNEGKTLSFDNGKTLAEKDIIIRDNFLSEIEKRSGVKLGSYALESYITNPNVIWAAFAIVDATIDMVLPDTIMEDLGIIADVRTGGFGDSFAFDIEPRDLFAVSKSSNGKRSAFIQKQYKGQVTVVCEPRQVTVGVSLYRVLSKQENLATFIMKAVRAIETQVIYDAYTLFNSTLAALPTTGNTPLAVAGYTQASFVKLAQTVTAWNGGKKAIGLGTLNAISTILPSFSGARALIDSEYIKLGYVRTLAGVDLLEMPQVADYRTEFALLLNDSNVYIVSPSADKIIKVCFEGAAVSYQDVINANADLTQTGTIVKRWGVAVATSSIAACILPSGN